MKRAFFLVAAVIVAGIPMATRAQTPRERTVFVNVIDKKGEPVGDLTARDFTLKEDHAKREIVSALGLANDLERIGDLAKNIAKRVIALNAEFPPPKLIRGVEHMADLVLTQLKAVLDAYAQRDLTKALAVWRGDEEIDAMTTSVFRELLTYMMEDPRNITFCIHLLFCAKNIERMGDHATNIAETVYYICEGRALTDERPKGDSTSSTTVPFPAA